MKTFIVQSLALIGTVLIIKEAASMPATHPNKTQLLKFIIHEANVSKTSLKNSLKKMVPDPSGTGNTCWMCFFCMAELSLEKEHFKNLSLTKYLHQYNKVAKRTNCTLDENRKCTLEKLLNDTIQCAKVLV